ncbi:MAG: hypothetical protein RMI49_01570 [Candidatus Caldarchaeum sp.]|nr:hypothetical protein [Candidatus Caldarchaeum sp.]
MGRRLKALAACFAAFLVTAVLVPMLIAAVRMPSSMLYLLPPDVINWIGYMVWFFGWPNMAMIAALALSFASGKLKIAVPAGLAAGALSYLGFIAIVTSVLP